MKLTAEDKERLRPRTKELFNSQHWYNPDDDSFGALDAPEFIDGKWQYHSVAYAPQGGMRQLAEQFANNEGFFYSRCGRFTPTHDTLGKKVLDLEFGADPTREMYDVVAVASGMAAINTLVPFALENANSKSRYIIAQATIYGGTFDLFYNRLPVWSGIVTHFVNNFQNIQSWRDVVQQHSAPLFFYGENDSNPLLQHIDNTAIAELAHEYGSLYVCDQTVGTPLGEKLFPQGVDIVIHSASKELSGGAVLGGLLIAKKDIADTLRKCVAAMGNVMDPRAAGHLLEMLQSFPRRFKTKQETAAGIVKFLKKHPRVTQVYWSGSTLLSFELDGVIEHVFRFLGAVRLCKVAPHLGYDKHSLILAPLAAMHKSYPEELRKELGFPDTLIRLSVGLEDMNDICDDLDRGFIAAFA